MSEQWISDEKHKAGGKYRSTDDTHISTEDPISAEQRPTDHRININLHTGSESKIRTDINARMRQN